MEGESGFDFDLMQATTGDSTPATKVRSIVCPDCDGNGKSKCRFQLIFYAYTLEISFRFELSRYFTKYLCHLNNMVVEAEVEDLW